MSKKIVTVIVLTYNPSIFKLLLTLESLMMQTNVLYEIVISDDGSENFPNKIIETYFNSKGFSDYLIITHQKNMGTVRNCIDAIKRSNCKYTKFISPGDFFAYSQALYDWVMFMDKNAYDLSFARPIVYSKIIDSKIVTCSVKIYPQTSNPKNLKRNCLLGKDLLLGASTMVNTTLMKDYLNKIMDRIVYCEDTVYRLMLLDDRTIGIFNNDSFFYEIGTGISTSKSNDWSKKIAKDYNELENIICDIVDTNKRFNRKLLLSIKYRRKGLLGKIKAYLSIPSLITTRLKYKIFPKLSNVRFNALFWEELYNRVNESLK